MKRDPNDTSWQRENKPVANHGEIGVIVRASSVRNNEDGTFTIHLPATELTCDEAATLRRLYPTLCDKAHELLDKEALIAAMQPSR